MNDSVCTMQAPPVIPSKTARQISFRVGTCASRDMIISRSLSIAAEVGARLIGLAQSEGVGGRAAGMPEDG
jgi:hypothetical protein